MSEGNSASIFDPVLVRKETLDVDVLIFVSYWPDISTVFRSNRNIYLFSRFYQILEELYSVDTPKESPAKHCL